MNDSVQNIPSILSQHQTDQSLLHFNYCCAALKPSVHCMEGGACGHTPAHSCCHNHINQWNMFDLIRQKLLIVLTASVKVLCSYCWLINQLIKSDLMITVIKCTHLITGGGGGTQLIKHKWWACMIKVRAQGTRSEREPPNWKPECSTSWEGWVKMKALDVAKCLAYQGGQSRLACWWSKTD